MNAPEPRAVFISYSSDDVEAAQRIATALRDSGIEVWFDRSELRGGDAWDQNIRRQIKECTLFLPIISHTTERRPEGYFRLEWRLADNRTHHMGRTKSFLVPVCISKEVNQSFADVPDSFLAVHWTLLPGGEPNQGFVDNVKSLLSGPPAGDAGRSRPAFPVGSRAPAGPAEHPATPAPAASPWRRRLLVGGAVLAVVAGLAAFGFVKFMRGRIDVAKTTIAVLPFKDNSDTVGAGLPFANGLQDAIIRKLPLITDFSVRPQVSVAQYRDNPKLPQEIAREQSALYIVDGTVTRVDDNAQVSVSLISAATNGTIWSKLYPPVDLKDFLGIQASMANSISEALKTELTKQEKSLQAEKPAGNVNAYGVYQGVFEAFGSDRMTPAGLKAATGKLEAAVDAAPDFAAAWGLLGAVQSMMVAHGFDTTEERIINARRAIDKAVEIDADSADTLRSQGIFLSGAVRDYPGAIERFQKLQALPAASADSAGFLGEVYRHQGKWTESLASLRTATNRDRTNLLHLRALERVLADTRNFDSARQTRLEILNILSPGSAPNTGPGGPGGPGGPNAGRGGRGNFQAPADTTIPVIADRPEESYALALLVLNGSGSTKPGDDFFKGLDPKLAATPRLIALKTDWLRRTNQLDEAIALDRQQPAFSDDGEPAWRQAIDLAAAYATKGDAAAARTRLNGVTEELQTRLVDEPNNTRLHSWLGLAFAILGEKESALRSGNRAVELVPDAVDAVASAQARLRLAIIQSWVGDTDAAFAGLTALLAKSGCEATIHSMKLDPWFSKLRAEARFASLLPLENQAPLIPDIGGLGGRGGGARGDPTGRGQDPTQGGGLNRGGGQRGGNRLFPPQGGQPPGN
jgi:TolB-like protein/Tfp pilus assembly protein PilF